MAKQLVRTKSKNEQVYEVLHARIIHGTIAPGERLVIDQIASELGVSQIPVREAVFRLEADGFVSFEPHVGAKVTELHAKEIREVFQILEAMEVMSGRAACATITDKQLAWLEDLVTAMAKVTGDPNEWSLHNQEFHAYICDVAGMSLVSKVLRQALDHWDRLRHYYLKEVSARRTKLAQQEHERLLAALHSHDADVLEHIIREHNRTSLAAYITHLEKAGTLP